MARLRYNGLDTTLGGSGLTNSATSITFAAVLTHSGGTNVPTLSGSDYIPLSILDSTGKLSEVVYLTAYTAAATTGTIVRGMEGTTGVSHSVGDKVICGSTVLDVSAPSPDAAFDNPSAYDDEFDGSSSVSWTAGPLAPTTFDINTTVAGAAYMRANSVSGIASELQAVPGSYPYTMTAKVPLAAWKGNINLAGLVLAPSGTLTSTTVAAFFGLAWSGGALVDTTTYKFDGTFQASIGGATSVGNVANGLAATIRYIRVRVNSATSVDVWVSSDGISWLLVNSAANIGFTPGKMGLYVAERGTADMRAAFSYFRVT